MKQLIGLTYWESPNNTIDYVSEYTIRHNAKYLDKLYLITNVDSMKLPKNVIKLETCKLDNFIKSNWGIELKPNFKSDILTYFGLDILRLYGYDHDRILELDTDYLLYNRLLIYDLFNNCNETISIKDNNEFLNHLNDSYYNCGAVYNTGSIDFKPLVDKVIGPDMKYTALGPSLINHPSLVEQFNKNPYSRIIPHTLDKSKVDIGRVNIFKQRDSLGCHLTVSILKTLGFKILDINQSYDIDVLEIIYGELI